MSGSSLAFSTLGQPGITVEEIVSLGQECSARGVELRVADGEILSASSGAAVAARIGSRLRDAGMTLVALNSYVRLCAPKENDADPVLSDLLEHIELASAAGAAGVRVFMHDETSAPDRGSTDRPLTDGEHRAVARLAASSDLLERTGVRVLIETHDSHSSGASLAPFLGAQPLDAPALGVIWDTAHSWAAGEALESSMRLLLHRLAHVQIKDVDSAADPRPTSIGSGSFPIDELAVVLEGSTWHGWISLEWERAWHPDLPPLAEALPAARQWANRIFDRRGTP